MKHIVLISNKVMHYRVSVYNYLHSRFAELGYELVVITDSLQENCPHKIQFQFFEIPFSINNYRRLLRSMDPEAVIFFLHLKDWIMFPLLVWLKFTRIKSIYWNHGVNLMDADNRIKNQLFRFAHNISDAIILYSSRELRYIRVKNHHKVFVAPNTLNFGDYPDIPDSKNCIRKRLGIPYERVVLFVGRILPYKRVDDLLEALPFLRENTGIVLAGGGLSKTQAQLINSEPRITYLGEIYDPYEINSIFKMADVFCSPGETGLAINQAFYWGLPLVVEDVMHGPEIMYLQPGVNGYVSALGDVEQLAQKINLILEEGRYSSFSNAARKEILEFGSIDNMFNGFLEALKYVQARQ